MGCWRSAELGDTWLLSEEDVGLPPLPYTRWYFSKKGSLLMDPAGDADKPVGVNGCVDRGSPWNAPIPARFSTATADKLELELADLGKALLWNDGDC